VIVLSLDDKERDGHLEAKGAEPAEDGWPG
jgi:hypothetical protein